MLTIYRVLERLCLVLDKLTTVVVLALTAAITMIGVAQIIGRFVFFYSLPWSEELSVYIFVWLIMLGGMYCVRDGAELRIDVVNPRNPAVARIMRLFQNAASLAMLIVFLVASLMHMQNALRFRQLSSSLQISMAWVYMVIPAGFILMGLAKALVLLRDLLPPRTGE